LLSPILIFFGTVQFFSPLAKLVTHISSAVVNQYTTILYAVIFNKHVHISILKNLHHHQLQAFNWPKFS
jgi:hypothetical protein